MKIVLFALCVGLMPIYVAHAGSGGGPAQTPDGILVPQPAAAANSVAVRLEVPGDQMLTGVRWFNGSDTEAFGRILAATGSELYPPSMTQALVVADSVVGTQNAWSSVMFTEPVASQTGTLFAVFQYQAGYTPTEGVTAHGVGYQMLDTPMYYFVSGDGQQWFKIASGCRIMIEPILAPRDLTVVALSEAPSEPQPVPLPKALALNAYPNPFNPSIKLELSLPVAGPVEVKVYDIRGGQVRHLYTGNEPAGVLTLTWDGRDNGGRRVSSGIYWARVVTAAGTLNRRMVMIK
jgi:hypothetical protein